MGQMPTKKKKGLVVGGVIGFLILVASVSGHSTPNNNSDPIVITPTTTQQPNITADTKQAAPTVTAQESAPAPTPTPTPAPAPKTCDSGYYINSDGNCVESPTYAPSAPAGATAECNDGTYSFSQHRSGTCSHHGGVASWL
jgi:hypothetical protein